MEKELTYIVKILEASRELSAKEKIAAKDTTDCVKLDQVLDSEEALLIDVDYFVVLDVNNENSKFEDKQYQQYILVDKNGTRYSTGSETLWNSYYNIYVEMKDEEEDYSIKVYRKPSNNFPGKFFITCSIV